MILRMQSGGKSSQTLKPDSIRLNPGYVSHLIGNRGQFNFAGAAVCLPIDRNKSSTRNLNKVST